MFQANIRRVTLRKLKRFVREGDMVLEAPLEIRAATQVQRRRLTQATTAARIYLGDLVMKTDDLARTLGVTDERAAQIVRLGIRYLQESGQLHPMSQASTPSLSDRGRG